MSGENCPKLCGGCPALPEGVQAELVRLRQPSEDFMRKIKFGGYAHGRQADILLAGMLVATFTVVESTNPAVELGDEAELLLSQADIRHDEVRETVTACSGPDTPSRMQRALGKRPSCLGLPPYEAVG